MPQVSPTELEGLLLEHPLVTDVGVTSVPAEMEGELPQAWVVRKNRSLTEKTCFLWNDNRKWTCVSSFILLNILRFPSF